MAICRHAIAPTGNDKERIFRNGFFREAASDLFKNTGWRIPTDQEMTSSMVWWSMSRLVKLRHDVRMDVWDLTLVESLSCSNGRATQWNLH